MPVFAKEDFLKAVGDQYGWLGGIDESGQLRCVLPYTIIRKAGFRLVRFRTQTIPRGSDLSLPEEKTFLNSVVEHFRLAGADVIIPGSHNAIFRTYPEGADAAPYGTYVIDLNQSEDVLWRNINRSTRLNIGTAQRGGVTVREGMQFLDGAYDLIRETFRRSHLPFMSKGSFIRYTQGLGEHCVVLASLHSHIAQSYAVFGFASSCSYAVYGGNVHEQRQGSTKLLIWEAMRRFRAVGVKSFDFFGARIDPDNGSKQEAINSMKERFGATLTRGYLWKYRLRKWRSLQYSLAVRILRGGDLVDQERHKLELYRQ